MGALALGCVGAAVTLVLDRELGLLLPLQIANARTLLGSLVSAVLTIAVFTLWMRTVVVGLAAGRVSPRIVVGHLDDRFQHRVAAWMVGGFGYVATVLLLLPTAGSDGTSAGAPALSVSGSVVITVVAFVGVLLALRAAIRALSLSHLVRRLTDQAIYVMRHPRGPDDPPPPSTSTDRVATRIYGDAMGWVQHIAYDDVIEQLPEHATLIMHVSVGEFVAPGELVGQVDRPLDDEAVARINRAISLAETRDHTRDLAFAIEQLIDVGQHAMTPTSNDTSTAHEVLVHLRVILRMLLHDGKFSCSLNGAHGRHVVSTDIWDPADHIDMAFQRLLQHAPQMPTLVHSLRATLASLRTTAEDVGDQRSATVLQRHLDALDDATDSESVLAR